MKTSGDIAGVILAGGRGERMGGLAKAFLEVGGGRAIDRLLTVYQRLFDEIVVAVRDREGFEDFGVTVAVDQVAIRSSLTGIHAGLWASKAPFVFVAPCDMPFLQPGLVQSLLAEVDGEADVVIPLKENGRVEPLCAVYSKSCLPHIKKQLEGGDCKIIRFFDQVRVKTVPVARLRKADPDLLSFVNLNTPDELAQARVLAASRRM